jgi:hypothetical protein
MSTQYDHEWLKARTVHIKGIPAEDRHGDGLKLLLNSYLKEHHGEVLALHLAPDFTKILEIEDEIQNLKDLKMLMVQDTGTKCCMPGKYKDP